MEPRCHNLAIKHYNCGDEIWLVTEADKSLALKIVKHFHFFTNFIASDWKNNIIAKTKANDLTNIFGINDFIYVGNSVSDLNIW
jgi:hypothetical protein